jgi:hypothetical protein
MCSDGELERTRDQNFDSSRNDNRQHAWRKCVASLRRNEQPVALICKRGCSNHSAKTTQAERSGGGSELTARHPPVPGARSVAIEIVSFGSAVRDGESASIRRACNSCEQCTSARRTN